MVGYIGHYVVSGVHLGDEGLDGEELFEGRDINSV